MMKKRTMTKCVAIALSFMIAAAGAGCLSQPAGRVEAATGYVLAWSDEFDGTSLNRSNWRVEQNGDGGGNGELQYYRDSPENIEVSGGALKIHALKKSYSGKSYTSGRINTKGLRSFKYGKIEARMKLPSFSGAWPAFWMLGANFDSIGWPKCGELDIMEAINTEKFTHGHVHWYTEGANYTGHADYGRSSEGKVPADFDRTQWHTYGVEWDKSLIRWFVDGVQFNAIDITGSDISEFQKEHFIIFNLAIGGSWPGYSIDDSAFPDRSTMEVDYVRVYQDGAGQTAPEQTTAYEGPTVLEEHDAVADNPGPWGSYFGKADWCDNADGTLENNGEKASDGATVHVARTGNNQWGVQAFLDGLDYLPGNTYTYRCTLTSDRDKVVFVKVAGDNDEEISGQFVSLKAGEPYEYVTQVYIRPDYAGVLDLYFGLGLCQGDTIASADGYTLDISGVSFTASVSVPATGTPPAETETEQKEATLPDVPGLTYAGNDDLPHYFAWGRVEGAEGYHVYVDGRLVTDVTGLSVQIDGSYFKTPGTYMIGVQAYAGDEVSAIATHPYTVETVAEEPSTTPAATEPSTAPATAEPSTPHETTGRNEHTAAAPGPDAETSAAPGHGNGGGDSSSGQENGASAPFGEAAKAELSILHAKGDKDPKGSDFGKLRARVRKAKRTENAISWRKIKGAAGYYVYGAKCGQKIQRLAYTNRPSYTHHHLKKGTYYKYVVMAADGEGNVLAVSRTIHSATLGGKSGNAKALKVGRAGIVLRKGERIRLRAKEVPASRKTKIRRHRPVCFESGNGKIAAVTKKGLLRARRRGTCKVYAYAQNGAYRVITVRVK